MTGKKYRWRSVDIRLLTIGASLLLSGLMVLTGWLPNEDAFTYIRTVDIFNEGGVDAAFSHYPWATYPVLIALVHNTLALEPFLAAVLVNAFFYGLLAYSFISLVAELNSSRTTLLFAAITVLVYPQLNENRLVIIRDSAYWSLALLGLWQYLRFLRNNQFRNAAAFSLAYLLAATFRAEALAFLFLLPASLLFDKRMDFHRRFLLLGMFTGSSAGFLFALTALGFLAGVDFTDLLANQLSVYFPFVQDTFFPTAERTAEMGRIVFGDYAANFTSDYLPIFLAAGLFAVFITYLVKGIGTPFLLIMLAGGLARQWSLPRWQLIPLLTVIAVNCLIAMGFLVTTRFLSSRYVMLMSLVFVLFVPLLLNRLLSAAQAAGKEKRYFWLVGSLLVYCAIDAYVSFGANKDYLRDAGEWIAQNSGPQATLLTNNRTVAYYSERIDDYDIVPVLLTESEILQLPAGSLIAYEEDTASLGLFSRASTETAVEEIIRIGPETSRQVVIYRRR
ncbi:MAG: hypothetical protein R3F50_07025 [Gammaproteobacteria bacterium]|jgi:hypothetical protein